MRSTYPSLSCSSSLHILLSSSKSVCSLRSIQSSSIFSFAFPETSISEMLNFGVSHQMNSFREHFVQPTASSPYFDVIVAQHSTWKPIFLPLFGSSFLSFPSSGRASIGWSGSSGRRNGSAARLPVGCKVEGASNETLPDDGDRNRSFVVTTPLFYVNAAPHMGSAYPTIAADALCRFQRLLGRKVVFVTGTDEHGEKIASAAAALHRQPKEHCDLVAAGYQDLWKEFGIAYDRFIRTTDSNHEKIVAEFYQRVYDKGDIYRAQYDGLYCVNCEEYKDEKELTEEKCCPIHRKECQYRKEDNYFFALSKYQKPIESWLASNPNFVRPSFRMNEVNGWVKEGLRDFSISRAMVEWGIPVPTDPEQTIYVWFDALLGYLSALLGDEIQPSIEKAAEGGWPASMHIIGKDILRFHAVYWPAMLMSAGLPLPHAIYGHGFLTKDGLKMGKSLGNTLEPKDLVARFGSDALRYYFLKEIEFGKDGDFSEERFVNIVNAHLANTIGNLLNRTLGLLKKNCDRVVPIDVISLPAGIPVRLLSANMVDKAKQEYINLHFSGACEALLNIAFAGNMYLDERAPWSRFKEGGLSAEAAMTDLILVLECVRIVAVGLSPIVPMLCRRIYLQLGYSESDFGCLSWDDTQWGGLKAGQVMEHPEPVFKKIEDTKVLSVNLAGDKCNHMAP